MDNIRKKFYYSGYLVFLCILIYVLFNLLSHIQNIIIMLIASVFIAYILLPLVNFFEGPIKINIPSKIKINLLKFKKEIKIANSPRLITLSKKGFSHLMSIIIVYIILLLLASIFLSYVIPKLSTEFNNLMTNLPTFTKNTEAKINAYIIKIKPKLPSNYKEAIKIDRYIEKAEQYAYKIASYSYVAVQKIFSIALTIMIIPIFTFYILLDIERFKQAGYHLIPSNKKEKITKILKDIDLAIGRYIRGQIFVAIFVGVAITISLLILGIDYAFLIGFVSGIFNIVPYIGVLISLVSATTVALFSKGFLYAVITFCVLEAIQLADSQVISPAIIGESVGLPPLIIIVSLFIGAQTLGLIGMLIAVPIVATIRVIVMFLLKMKENNNNNNKGL